MPVPSLLQKIKSDSEVRDILDWPFDFNLTVTPGDADWLTVKPAVKTTLIACDGTGGLFVLYGPHEYLLHITSEGQAGIIARDLEEGLRLMIARPDWRDLLKFSGGGQLAEMRRLIPFLDRDLAEEHPEIEEQRAVLKKNLSLKELDDPIASLHEAVAALGKGVVVSGPDGSEFTSLFGEFTADRNPYWK